MLEPPTPAPADSVPDFSQMNQAELRAWLASDDVTREEIAAFEEWARSSKPARSPAATAGTGYTAEAIDPSYREYDAVARMRTLDAGREVAKARWERNRPSDAHA